MAQALGIVSAVFSVVSGVQSFFASRESADAFRASASLNQAIAAQNRATALENAEIEAANLRRDYQREKAQNIVRVGASGVTLEGSPLAVLSDNTEEFFRETDLIMRQGRITADNATIQGNLQARNNFINAGNTVRQGRADLLKGFSGAGRSLLTSGFFEETPPEVAA